MKSQRVLSNQEMKEMGVDHVHILQMEIPVTLDADLERSPIGWAELSQKEDGIYATLYISDEHNDLEARVCGTIRKSLGIDSLALETRTAKK